MPCIFISYRRDDTGYIAGMLAERLEDAFGSQSVFIDVDAIPLGVDFREYLNQAVAKSDLMLALIGDDWLNTKNAQGLRRLDDPADFVRIEIEAALKENIPVVPVLLGQASMPLESSLPPSLQALAFRNAAEIRSGRDLTYHIEQLIRGIKTHYENLNLPAPSSPLLGIEQAIPTTTSEAAVKTKRIPVRLLLGVISLLVVIGVAISLFINSLSQQPVPKVSSTTLAPAKPITNNLPASQLPNTDNANADLKLPKLEVEQAPSVEQVPLTHPFDISSLMSSLALGMTLLQKP